MPAGAFAFVRTSRTQVMSDLEAVQDVLNSALKGRLQRTGDVSFFSTASASPQVRSILEAAGGAN